ncbi:substrate-binding domain-containing protein [Mycolicibacterium goodii]|uniref:Molybdenum ABC transporter substrate-binding protein n=1 Tax=Mycolicibacterium goodii TaxID=134601 RepID=A0A0K0X1D0_MYCGD|nr:hypothetical protein AFA91_03800 [Mycolicibacterium goodii]
MSRPSATLFSTLAVRGALESEVLPRLRKTFDVAASFDPTSVLVNRIDAGERPDIVVAVSDALDKLRQRGVVTARSAVARTGIGVGTASGAVAPQISTVPELVHALRSAQSVAYSRSGASGLYFAGLLDRLGIADDINRRATIIDKGFTGQAVVDGRADLAIQQISELAFIDGIKIAGPLPEAVQHYTDFGAACFTGSAAAARDILRELTSEYARSAYRRAGLDC